MRKTLIAAIILVLVTLLPGVLPVASDAPRPGADAALPPENAGEGTLLIPRTYLPLVARNYVGPQAYLVKLYYDPFGEEEEICRAWGATKKGDYTLQDALSGEVDIFMRSYDGLVVENALYRYNFDGQYYVRRSMLSCDLSFLPEGTIVSASLELYAREDTTTRGDRAFDVLFWEGTWSGLKPTRDDWDARGTLLGAIHTDDVPTTEYCSPVVIPLPGLEGRPRPEVFRLLVQGDEVTEMTTPGDEMWAWFLFYDDRDVENRPAYLHLVIEEAQP